MKLMVDNDLSYRLATGLHAIFEGEHEIVALRHKFGRTDVADEEWIKHLGAERDWAVLSGDRRIARNRVQRDLFIRSGLVGFFFAASLRKKPLHLQCARMLAILPTMAAYTKLTASGVVEVPASGSKFRQIGR